MKKFHIPYHHAQSKILGPTGSRFAEVFKHGTLSIELYEPKGRDHQTPHTQDEGYIVIKGSGEFVNGDERVDFSEGDFLFAAAGDVHRFENFSDDLSVWVIFYGPEGGEKRKMHNDE